MSDFQIFLQLGFQHITDLKGYDHILFVVVLCAIYRPRDWRRVLILVTAFTLGHSITLALATLRLFSYRTEVIEALIPVTILATAITNFFVKDPEGRLRKPASPPAPRLRYAMALGFGLIHGLGFSNYLRSLLGREASIVEPLLAFNIGLELGQLVIVAVVLLLTFLVVDVGKAKKRDWTLILSGAVAGVAIILIKDSELVQGWLG
ncbi:MAG: HupE/UreJ family protein [Cytophagaceae bacterium]|nr:HupE/UreJ family protein [Cytophagaceae bacterium]